MDSLAIFAGMNAKKLTEETCQKIGDIKPAPHDVVWFPQNTFRVRLRCSVAEKDVYIIQSLYPNPHNSLMELRQLAWTVNHRRAKKVTAILAFDPYLRSDREDEPRVCITASLNADLSLEAGIQGVAIVAPHFYQIAGYYGKAPCYLIKTVDLLAEKIKDLGLDFSKACIVAPDDKRTKDARQISESLKDQPPVVILSKKRFSGTKTRINYMIGEPKPLCIIVDDEVLSGGTIKAAVKYLKKHGGEKFIIAFTHNLSQESMLEYFEQEDSILNVITTNTIPITEDFQRKSDKLQVISIVKRLSKIIDGLHFGKDIDEHLIIEKKS
jgi:ribose-phosphate pyrophosphokinase